VGPDQLAPLTACPQCRAAVRPDAPWCTQCFFDLRPPAPREPEPEPHRPTVPLTAPAAAAYGLPAVDPLTAPLAVLTGGPAADQPVPGTEAAPAQALPTWPCLQCGVANSFDDDHCSVCGHGFLAGVHDDDISLVIPGVGDLVTMSKTKATWLALASIAALMSLVVLIGLLFH
jgi:hypothetical protein